MRRRPLVLVLFVGVLVGLVPPAAAVILPHADGPAGAAVITVYDPADAPCDQEPFCWVDIHVATVRRYMGGTGRRMIAVTIIGYEPIPHTDDSSLKVRFDTTGGPRSDWFVRMGEGLFGVGYSRWWCGRQQGARRYHIKVAGERMTCFVPVRDLDPTKPIRFQAFAKLIGGVVDRAPDQGWAS